MIHIYSKEGKFKDSLNYTITEFESSWYDNYQPGDFISETKFEHPIGDSGIVREMTRKELLAAGYEVQLNPGEIVSNGEIIIIEKPQSLIKPNWNGKEWIEGYTVEEYHSDIDRIKAEILSEGYTWKGHKQKVRDKDIGLMTATIESLRDYQDLYKKELRITWYFDDNDGVSMGTNEMKELRLTGLTFIQKVYTVENILKTGDLGVITKDKYIEMLNK
ncbi:MULTISPECIES: penicillin-binding protein [unclassified Fusobacterium]|uniref:penicillin-binding protein n=1 Tax=unclassified Fusobacterium TaxID=2648384 RepID=UPI001B8ABDC9|nr:MULTISPECIES: penicillin-binding protein [unclassified Fusobacterium]MBR8701487.1 hypothetical protein [Fusobacterium sp. DD45]MBR8711734.1 hypothetical protein [Fusobacterium sp. DD28]MBR8752277.1 hypothetical protein [Fusobacterium sp. DD26]